MGLFQCFCQAEFSVWVTEPSKHTTFQIKHPGLATGWKWCVKQLGCTSPSVFLPRGNLQNLGFLSGLLFHICCVSLSNSPILIFCISERQCNLFSSHYGLVIHSLICRSSKWTEGTLSNATQLGKGRIGVSCVIYIILYKHCLLMHVSSLSSARTSLKSLI